MDKEPVNGSNLDTKITGDPFVDTGTLVLKNLAAYFPAKSLLEQLEYVTDVYIEKWHQKLHSVFHTNSKILNPSTPGKHKQQTLDYYQSVLKNARTDDSIYGFCKVCGNQSTLYENSRSFLPLSGSGAFVNFHHGHERGSYLCGDCSIKLYFVPLGVLKLGQYIGLLHSQSEVSRNFISKTIIRQNLDKIQHGSSESILPSEYSNPKNALFDFASKIINDVNEENFSDYLQLYHFTNFGAGPACTIYVLPHPVFKFLNKVLNHHKSDWFSFIRRHYRIRNAKWDAETDQLVVEKKNKKTVLTEAEYINFNNLIYEKLLTNQTILPQLRKNYKAILNGEINQLHINIANYYVMEVLGMKDEQIKLIKRIADTVFELSQLENNYKRYLVWLEKASKAYELRGALLKIIKAYYKTGAKEPLIRLEEYVNYLFPDGQYWGEVRDLMLIYLYERMHDAEINVEEIPEEPVEITEETPTDKF